MDNENACRERHRNLDEKISAHERRINKHSERLDIIENGYSRLEERLSNLINQLNSLNITLRWFMGLILGGMVGFFFYAAQQGLLG